MRRLIPLLVLAAFSIRPAHAAPTFLDDEAEAACNVSFSLQKGNSGSFSLFFDHKDAQNGYVLETSANSASFFIVQKGQKRRLAQAPVKWQTSSAVTLQRRAWQMRLIVDDRVVLTAFDSSFQTGKIGSEGAGWSWKDARVQPVEPIHFDDDFTRTGGEGDDIWSKSGKWVLSASTDNISARNAAMSSNPFAYVAQTSNQTAFSSAGRKFWDGYDARIAVRPDSSGTMAGKAGQQIGTIGIAAYVQDPKNYLTFVWDGRDDQAARRLVRVQNGIATTLAQAAGAYVPRQWYEIGIRTSPGEVEAMVDGVSVLRARDDSFGQGSVGLIAQNLDSVAFDDLKVRSYDALNSDSTAKNGAWTTRGAFALLGRPAEGAYRFQTQLQRAEKDGFGLVTGYKDEKNYALFRAASAQSNLASSAPFRGRQQIVRVVAGQETVLSDAPLAFDLASRPMLTLSAENGALQIAAQGQTIAQAAQAGLTDGQVGLWNASSFAPQTDFTVPPAPEAPKIADRMEGDAYMVGWASATGEWPPIAGAAGLEFWNSGEFFGDASLEFPWRTTYQGRLDIALRAARGQFDSGLVLRGESSDKKTIQWSLLRGAKTLASASAPIPASSIEDELSNPFNLKVKLQGQGIVLFAGETPILSALDDQTPAGHALGVRASGFRVRTERLRAVSLNRQDSTFTGAPTDFYSPQGNWNIFSRWPCYGDWSFFGGQGLNPVLWSKQSYGGDIVAEMYAHPQMILPKEPGYAHPGDLNLTLCGDGKNPSSGYSFVLAGWDNTRSKLLRGTQVLAENHGAEAFFHETFNQNMQWHRRWFYIRAAATRAEKDGKSGVQLTLFVDDRPILSAFDPNPLPTFADGGRVAFWTVDSTLMIARAKIEAEKLGAKTLPIGLLDATPQPEIATVQGALQPFATVVGDAASSIVARDTTGWNVQNPASGGFFETQLNCAPLTATPQTRFSLDAQIPADVKIDAYLLIAGTRYSLEMTGGQKPDPSAPSLGAMTRVAATWSFDVGAALAKRFPGQTSWKIESLSLGARHGDNYRWLGFGGNALGATYHLGNLKWEG